MSHYSKLNLAFFLHIFSFYVHQDNIFPHLTYVFVRNNVFSVMAKEAAEAAGTRHDQRQHAAGL